MFSTLPHTPLTCTTVTYICLQPSTHSGHMMFVVVKQDYIHKVPVILHFTKSAIPSRNKIQITLSFTKLVI
jgi:hypothetical protein